MKVLWAALILLMTSPTYAKVLDTTYDGGCHTVKVPNWVHLAPDSPLNSPFQKGFIPPDKVGDDLDILKCVPMKAGPK